MKNASESAWSERFALWPKRLSDGSRVWLSTFLERRMSRDIGALTSSWTETKRPGDPDPVRRRLTLRRMS